MSTILLISNPTSLYVGFSLLGVVLLLLLVYAGRHLFRRKGGSASAGQAVQERTESPAASETPEMERELVQPEEASVPGTPVSILATEESRILRIALIVLAWAVAASLVLLLIPQGTVEQWAETLRMRAAPPPPTEPIALIYLGDQLQGRDMHIRGAIRNISSKPVENVDAVIRFKAADGSLIETAIARMDTDFIAPDATATFNLVYPGYAGQFSSYSVDFKTRDGEPVPFKDLRGARQGG